MTLPPSIRVNVGAPFPARVQGSGPIVITKLNGVWTFTFSVASLVAQTPPPVKYPTDFLIVYDSVANTSFKMPISAVLAARVAVADVNYAVTGTEGIIAYTSITATRTITLPAANTFAPGRKLFIVDESGSATTAITINVTPNGTDTINGLNATRTIVNSAFGGVSLESDGSAKWTNATVNLGAGVHVGASILGIGNGGTGGTGGAEMLGGSATGINMNSANTDTPITITSPTTNYRVVSIVVLNTGPSASLGTATVGMFTAAGGGGSTIATNATLFSISTAAINNAGNSATLNTNSAVLNLSTIYFRVGTPQGATATASAYVFIQPLP